MATLSTALSKKISVQTLQNMGMTLEGLLNSKKNDELDPDNMDGEDFMKKRRPCCMLDTIWLQYMLGCGRGDRISVWQGKGYKDNSKNG